MDSEETLPALQDERRVMSFLVRPAAVLISHFFLSYDEFGEDESSPVVHVCGSLVCHVDLDFLWMVPWDDCRTFETRSHTGISILRSVMCSVARLSRMPVLLDTGCLKSFGELGRECVLDLNAGETYTPVWSPDCAFETIPPKPPFPPCHVVVVPSAIVKVVSVPDSRCVRVVTLDDLVNIGFHKVLIHDLEDEDLPFVTVSELRCLRLDWPKTLFTFMSRYQFDLDQIRKECRERFGCTQSGNCTHCGKHIQQMSRTSLRDMEDRTADVSSRPNVTRR